MAFVGRARAREGARRRWASTGGFRRLRHQLANRCSGAPDTLDRTVGMAFGTMAFEALESGTSGLLTAVVDGLYQTTSLAGVRAGARPANVEAYYDADAYRPRLRELVGRSILLG